MKKERVIHAIDANNELKRCQTRSNGIIPPRTMPRLPLRPRTSVRAVYLVTTHSGLRQTNQLAHARSRNWLKLMLPVYPHDYD